MERMKDWQDKQAKRAMRRTLDEGKPAPAAMPTPTTPQPTTRATTSRASKPAATPPAERMASAPPPTSGARGTSTPAQPPAPGTLGARTANQPPHPRAATPLASQGTPPRPRSTTSPTPATTAPRATREAAPYGDQRAPAQSERRQGESGAARPPSPPRPTPSRTSPPGVLRRPAPTTHPAPVEPQAPATASTADPRRARATEPPGAAELNAAPILELPRRPRASRPLTPRAGMAERPEPTPLPARGDEEATGAASLQEIVRVFRARLEARRGSAREDGGGQGGAVVAPPMKMVCPICGGAGYLRQELPPGDPFFGQPVPCKCKERELEERRWQELKRFSSLEPFADKTFETFHTTVPGVREAYDIARHYASDPMGWLVLSGPYGCGKTHLAAAVAQQQLAMHQSVFFAVVPDLLHQLRAAFGPNSEISHDAMFDAIREVGLLVLDDLGAENGTAWAQEKLFQIINYRYNYRMPTVVTTNHQLQSRLDERLRSRLSDLSFVQYVVIKAGDYRPRNTRRQR